MRNDKGWARRVFKGAGFILGFIIGAVIGISTVAITGINGIIEDVSASIAIPAGYFLEKKFQKKLPDCDKENRKFYFLLLILGTVLFFCLFLIAF
jgi:hypothetical protein